MTLELKTRTELVTDAIREMIMSGELTAGELLKQTKLAETLGVSRIPVRGALYQLEGEGLVVMETHKGATVTPISAREIEEIFDLRATLECKLLEQSMGFLSSEDVETAENILNQLDRAIYDNHDRAAIGVLNEAFHDQLYRGAALDLTADIVRTLNKKAQRYVRIHITHAGGYKTAQAEHHELLGLVKLGNKEGAVNFLRKHLEAAKIGLLKLTQ